MYDIILSWYTKLFCEEGFDIPTISMFYGILIQMFNNNEHNPPHFHALYGEHRAVFNFDGQIIKGSFPSKQVKLISAWTEIHKEELLANWQLAINGEALYKIEPLK